jgi:hypothetical protein
MINLEKLPSMTFDEAVKSWVEEDLERARKDQHMNETLDKIFSFKNYHDFSEVPEAKRNQDGAYNWLFMKETTPGSGRKTIREWFRQIPVDLWQNKTLEIAFSKDIQTLADIQPGTVPDYLKICMTAYKTNSSAALYFHESFHTADTVEAMIEASPGFFKSAYGANPWMARVITPTLLEKAAIESLIFMVSLPEEQITDAALGAHLERGYMGYAMLRDSGKLKLAANFLKTVPWPEGRKDTGENYLIPPRDIRDALERAAVLYRTEPIYQSVYMAYVINQPIEDVIAQVNNKAFTTLVLEMYSEKELLPHIKNNRRLKAGLLENSLGL